MLKILEFLVGKTNCSAVAFNELGNSFSRSQLHGKLLNIGSEVEFNSVTSSGYFKQIVSGDTISAQEKYKPEFIFNPFCKLVFSSNDFPMTKDKTHGYYRRWILIIMDRIFGPNEQNHNLLNELKEELRGIS